VTTLETRSALATFPKIVLPAADGRTIGRCTLKTQASNGDYFEITFRNVLVQMVNAIASAAGAGSPRYAYVQTSFAFEDVEVSTVSSGVDDGGVSPAPTN
jgi:type VI protein secretion system component Hcp